MTQPTLASLGLGAAKQLKHNSFLLGIESGNTYVVKSLDAGQWQLVNLHTRAVWGSWATKDCMIRELATAHMQPTNPC